MILADTSIWIEFFRQTNFENSQKFTECIESNSVIAISPVFGELLQGVRNDREEKVILEYWTYLPKIKEENLFVEAGRISNHYKLFNKGVRLIDCYILAAAKINKLELWSLDKKLLQVHHLI